MTDPESITEDREQLTATRAWIPDHELPVVRPVTYSLKPNKVTGQLELMIYTGPNRAARRKNLLHEEHVHPAKSLEETRNERIAARQRKTDMRSLRRGYANERV